MAHRFIDSDILKHPFTRSLKGAYKTFLIYLFCDCNSAGIWSVDFEAASMYCDGKIEREKVEKIFKGKYVEVNGGGKWFFPGFIEFQYKGILCKENKAHTKIIETLLKYNQVEFSHSEIDERSKKEKTYFKLKETPEGGSKPLHEGDKVKVKVKDKVTVKATVKEEVPAENFEEEISVHRECIKLYDQFTHTQTGTGAKIDGQQGKAMKSIIDFLMKQPKIQNDKRKTIDAWKYLLDSWDKLDAFTQKRMKISQIDSDLTNIIGQIKNGKSNSKTDYSHSSDGFNELFNEFVTLDKAG